MNDERFGPTECNPLSILGWLAKKCEEGEPVSFGIVEHLKRTEEMKRNRPVAGKKIPSDYAEDYLDRISICVEVDGVKGQVEVICEIEIEEREPGTEPNVSVKWASTIQGVSFPLTPEQEEEAIADWWKKQDRLSKEARDNEH